MKTYKVTRSENFSHNIFSSKPIHLNKQTTIEGIEPPPLTTIFKERPLCEECPFDQYFVEHEKIENAPGRTGNLNFHNYIHRYAIYAYHLPKSKLLLLQGKKKAVLDLMRHADLSLNIKPLFIDLNPFQNVIEKIQMVWFRFYDGQFSSTSFHGENIKSVIEQQDLFRKGRISTMAFTLTFEGRAHPMMLSHDGTIVLQAKYEETTEELQLLHHFYNRYLEPFLANENPMKQSPEWKEDLIEEIEEGLSSQNYSFHEAM